MPSASVELTEGEVVAAIESVARLKPAMTATQSAAQPPPPRHEKCRRSSIDPGHGGVDTGAEGRSGSEKDIVLAVARELNESLLATGRYRVVMTRTSDVFVPLERRIRNVAAAWGAALHLAAHGFPREARTRRRNPRGHDLHALTGRIRRAGAASRRQGECGRPARWRPVADRDVPRTTSRAFSTI